MARSLNIRKNNASDYNSINHEVLPENRKSLLTSNYGAVGIRFPEPERHSKPPESRRRSYPQQLTG